MRQVEIKNVSIGAAFTFFGGLGVVTGLLLGLFGETLFQKDFLEFLTKQPLLREHAEGVTGSLIFGVMLGVASGFLIAIIVAVYNVFATLLGGVRVTIEDKD